ncbi:MAG: hypothetical protein Q7T76_19990 [Ferruginibacter sp.]|nr:hypothetical protein [Ferruginibacter sp.]
MNFQKRLSTYLVFPIVIFASYLPSSVFAQVTGCTDPLSNNYNPAATVNDGSCTYNATSYTPPVKVNPLNDAVVETSGLQMMGNYLWTFNDSQGGATLYRIDTITNTILQQITLAGATNIDWEDIAFDGRNVYIGDFGNNANGARADLKIYKFPFNAIPDFINNYNATISAQLIERINFSYSDQPMPLVATAANTTKYDCEAMLVDAGKIHLFTKNWANNNTTHYVIADTTAGTYSATPLETLATNYLVTAADKIPGQDVIALLGYQNAGTANHFMHLLSGYTAGNFFNGNKRKIDLPDVLYMGQSEGLTFRNGLYGYISNEKFVRTIFTTTITVNQQLHSFALTGLLQTVAKIYQFTGNGNWDVAANWSGNIVPPASLIGGSEIIIDPIAGGNCVLNISYTLSKGSQLTVRPGKNLIVSGSLDIQQ